MVATAPFLWAQAIPPGFGRESMAGQDADMRKRTPPAKESKDGQGSRMESPCACVRRIMARWQQQELVLHRHRFGVYRLLTGDTFQSCEDATVLVLVALHGEAALLFAIYPGQPNEVFLGFRERHQRTHPERKDPYPNRSTNPS